MKQASTDITYCVKECDRECTRKASGYNFKAEELYSFTNECIEKELYKR